MRDVERLIGAKIRCVKNLGESLRRARPAPPGSERQLGLRQHRDEPARREIVYRRDRPQRIGERHDRAAMQHRRKGAQFVAHRQLGGHLIGRGFENPDAGQMGEWEIRGASLNSRRLTDMLRANSHPFLNSEPCSGQAQVAVGRPARPDAPRGENRQAVDVGQRQFSIAELLQERQGPAEFLLVERADLQSRKRLVVTAEKPAVALGDYQRGRDQRGRIGKESAEEKVVAVRPVQSGDEGRGIDVALSPLRHRRSRRWTGWSGDRRTPPCRCSASRAGCGRAEACRGWRL